MGEKEESENIAHARIACVDIVEVNNDMENRAGNEKQQAERMIADGVPHAETMNITQPDHRTKHLPNETPRVETAGEKNTLGIFILQICLRMIIGLLLGLCIVCVHVF